MLNKELGAAIRPAHVIEIVGEAGSGKTQFGLHISARSVEETNQECNSKDVKETKE